MSLAKERIVIVCGNSSSVIKEAPINGAHSLNIGVRQAEEKQLIHKLIVFAIEI